MGYVKSHSNYVIKKHHQTLDNGIIYERDITTIGGLNQFAKGQTPIYKSSNFIITVNDEIPQNKDYTNNKWFNSDNNDNVWTLDNLSGITNQSSTQMNDLNQTYYDLLDFAYYGSCSELIRASITDIVDRFPGELYAPIIEDNVGIKVYYVADKNVQEEDSIELSYGEYCYLFDNPFNIDIHSKECSVESNKLKFFANCGYSNYMLSNTDVFDEDNDTITSWQVTSYDCGKGLPNISDDENDNTYKVLSKIEISSKIKNITIYAMLGDNGNIIYLTNKNGLGYHIRPKKYFLTSFLDTLDNFQSILLNVNSKPKYSSLFKIIKENSYGYYNEIKRFTFPTTFGNYNLAVNDSAYAVYLNELSDIAAFYDEVFSDNLYRVLTHEAIKNFDWSYSREYPSGNESEYVFGGTRMQNLLHLFGREFDELKHQIDGISNVNNLSYDNTNNMDTSGLVNTLINDGWDVINVNPFKLVNDKYIKDVDYLVTPYSNENVCLPNGYFINFTSKENCKYDASYIKNENPTELYKINSNKLQTKIIQYYNDKSYSASEINNQFMKILRLNSRQILRHKGTIEGVEMILALFGFRSKRWYDRKLKNKNCQRIFSPYSLYAECDGSTEYDYDYEIKEYVAFTKPIEDEVHNGVHIIDWYNQTKTIAYDTDTYRNGYYVPYQGLPVIYDDVYEDDNGNYTRYLLPFFDKDGIIDGNPYYQMNGGWLWKTKQFNYNDNIVETAYTETIKYVPSVNNLIELLAVPYTNLKNGNIYLVSDLNTDYAIIDGVAYELLSDYINNEIYYYFNVQVYNNSVKVGQQIYIDDVVVSSPYGIDVIDEYGDIINKELLHVLSDYKNGNLIRIYLIDGKCSIRNSFINDISFLNAFIFRHDKEIYSNYFKIVDRNHKNEISNDDDSTGWVQLKLDSEDFKSIGNSENYFSGNNPHLGNNIYDDGSEYLDYFKHLFKYAVENNQFNPRCYYGQLMDNVLQQINNIGFNSIDNIESLKIDSFCNIYKRNDDTITTHIFNNGKKNTDIDNVKYYNIRDIKEYSGLTSYVSGDSIAYEEQIINIKRVDITFKVQNTDINDYVKYVDDVVLNYVSQMIPPNTIVKIIYDNKTPSS